MCNAHELTASVLRWCSVIVRIAAHGERVPTARGRDRGPPETPSGEL